MSGRLADGGRAPHPQPRPTTADHPRAAPSAAVPGNRLPPRETRAGSARPPPTRLALARHADADDLLERFLVAAVAAFLGIRLYLAATGYPQIGGAGLHIAHMLWGGLLMLAALVAILSFLGRRVRGWAALVGGLGFGTFIDELGKFITSDNDYFFRPTIAIIYVIFVGLFFAFREIGRRRPTPPRTELVAVLDIVAEGVVRGFRPEDRARALRLLAQYDPNDPLTRSLHRTIEAVGPAAAAKAGGLRAIAQKLRGWYAQVAGAAWFRRLVVALFVLQIVATALGFAIEIVRDPSFSNRDWSFSLVDAIRAGASLVADGMILIGVVRLRASRLAAFEWFKRSLLVTLFLSQVYWFYAEELQAVGPLALNLALLAGVSYAIRREQVAVVTPPPVTNPQPGTAR